MNQILENGIQGETKMRIEIEQLFLVKKLKAVGVNGYLIISKGKFGPLWTYLSFAWGEGSGL
ncbi:hypothetical protein ES702_02030 [subsurface metagenome]